MQWFGLGQAGVEWDVVERGGVGRDRVRLDEVGRNGAGGGWVTGFVPSCGKAFFSQSQLSV